MIGLKLWMIPVAAAAAFGVGAAGGWATRDAFCDAAYWKAEAAQKQKALDEKDAELAQAQLSAALTATLQKELEDEKAKAEAAKAEFDAIGDRCVPDASDLERLYQILGQRP